MLAEFKYPAFISYSHRDRAWADWLHKSLESYRIPKQLVGVEGENGKIPDRLFPVYRDRDEFPAASDLAEHIKVALSRSAFLIVICSPSAARSRWVNEEILLFKRMGREQNVLAIIVDGEPNAADEAGADGLAECFPTALKFRLGADGVLSSEVVEPVAADARPQGDGKENAKLKLIAGLLGTDFGALKQRDLEAARRRSRIYGAIAASMAVLAVVAAGGGVLAYHYAQRSEVMRQAAVTQATTAEKTKDFMVSLFSMADPEKSRGDKVTAREMLDRGVAQIDSGLKGEVAVRSNLLRSMGQAYTGLGLYSKASSVLRKALDAAKRAGTPDDVMQAELALGASLGADGEYASAKQIYLSALADAQRLHGPAHATVSDALNGLGDSQAGLGENNDAERLYRRALAMDIQLHGERSEETSRTEDALATLLYSDGRYTEAEDLFRKAIVTRTSLFGSRDAVLALLLNNLGAVQFQTGKYDAAEATYQQALPVYRTIYGDDHPEVAAVLNNLGRVQLIHNKLAEAQTPLAQALTTDRKFLGRQDETLIPPLNSLGMIALAQGDLSQAKTFLDEALKLATAHKSWMLDQVLGNCAELYARTSRLEDARKTLTLARQTQQQEYGDKLKNAEAWRVAVLDMAQITIEMISGRADDARQTARKILPVLQARFGADGFYPRQTEALLTWLKPQG